MAPFGRKREDSQAGPPRVTVIAQQAYRCSLCLEEIAGGTSMFLCGCEQMFHDDCSPGVFLCPKCRSPIRAPLPELAKRGFIASSSPHPHATRARTPISRTFDEALESARKAWNNEDEK